ncbi:MAG: gliding motility lipoprotein GldD [Bacteroidetes bacterium]|nr:gliding motility lipoprotein GldD [Bacteroidota bacterium]
MIANLDHPVSSHPAFLLLQITSGIINPDFSFSMPFLSGCIVLIVLLFTSGFISGSETSFFAISPAELMDLKDSKNTSEKLIYRLLNKPKGLLATLLITINFVNIAIVVLSSLLINILFNFEGHETWGFIIQVVAVTFVIVLFCEVMPKVYAQQNAMRTARFSVYPVYVLDKLLKPISYLLIASTSFVEKRITQKSYDVSVDELTHAIDVTSDKDTDEEEKKILKGIARFGNIDVRQIMRSRMDVVGIDDTMKFSELLPYIIENHYSRLPVFKESFDSVTGVLYTKDLLPFLNRKEDETFQWQQLVRPGYFVPESKKINDLLQEFQEKKMHLAIVVDEYGGNSGIVTLEDILEEIVGEIHDEFDEEELSYSKLDDHNFVFDGKALINDVCRVMELDRNMFDSKNDGVDTLAGLILEMAGGIPVRGEMVEINGIKLKIESADKRRIKRVKITLPENKNTSGNTGVTAMIALLVMSSLLLTSCEQEYVPKPKGFFRIALPEKSYHIHSPAGCPFEFEIPAYAVEVKDSSPYAEPCFMDIQFPVFNATVYLTYKPVKNDLKKLYEDHRSMTMKHIPKANAIDEEAYNDAANRVFGSRYNIKGNAASNTQFYLTDSTNHFIRGSLYFYSVPQPDSIAPVLAFINEDIKHMIETFRWK